MPDGFVRHGMQEARGSSPLSSTFTQVNGMFWLSGMIVERLQSGQVASASRPLMSWKLMQVRTLLHGWESAMRLSSLSDSQTGSQC